METSIRKEIKSKKAVILNDDNVLWKGNIIRGIEAGYFRDQSLSKIVPFSLNYLKIMKLRRNGGKNGHLEELEMFYNFLKRNEMGSSSETREYASFFIDANQIKEIKYLLRDLSKGSSILPIYLATLNFSMSTEGARNFFSFINLNKENVVSNIEHYSKNGRLKDTEIVIHNGEEKLNKIEEMLSKSNIKLEDCAAIVSREDDLPLIEKVPLSLASPFATLRVKRHASLILSESAII